MTKATLRKNGEHMLTLRCTFHINLKTATALLADHCADTEEITLTTKVQAIDIIRRQIALHGDEMYYMDEKHDEGEWEELKQVAAQRLVELGIFPQN